MILKAPFPGLGLLGLEVLQVALAERDSSALRHDVIRRT